MFLKFISLLKFLTINMWLFHNADWKCCRPRVRWPRWTAGSSCWRRTWSAPRRGSQPPHRSWRRRATLPTSLSGEWGGKGVVRTAQPTNPPTCQPTHCHERGGNRTGNKLNQKSQSKDKSVCTLQFWVLTAHSGQQSSGPSLQQTLLWWRCAVRGLGWAGAERMIFPLHSGQYRHSRLGPAVNTKVNRCLDDKLGVIFTSAAPHRRNLCVLQQSSTNTPTR